MIHGGGCCCLMVRQRLLAGNIVVLVAGNMIEVADGVVVVIGNWRISNCFLYWILASGN